MHKTFCFQFGFLLTEKAQRGPVVTIYIWIIAGSATDTLHKSFQLIFARKGKIILFSNETSNRQQLLSDTL